MGVKDSYNLLTDFRFQFIHFGSDNILYNPSLIHGGKVKHLIVERGFSLLVLLTRYNFGEQESVLYKGGRCVGHSRMYDRILDR